MVVTLVFFKPFPRYHRAELVQPFECRQEVGSEGDSTPGGMFSQDGYTPQEQQAEIPCSAGLQRPCTVASKPKIKLDKSQDTQANDPGADRSYRLMLQLSVTAATPCLVRDVTRIAGFTTLRLMKPTSLPICALSSQANLLQLPHCL